MTKQRITLSDLKVGEPVPWDAYSAEGSLLLRRGQSVPSQQALERLVEEGLFLQGADASRRVEVSAAVSEQPTAMQHLVDAQRSLAHLFGHGPEQCDDFQQRMARLIASVESACALNAALGISSILLLSEVGYTVKHPIDTAILTCLLARELNLDDATRSAAIGAALTMNIGMCEFQDKVDAIQGPLNEKLVAMLHQHPRLGVDRLKRVGVDDEAWLDFVLQHHESLDGSGYPAALRDPAISVGARIIAIADKYCAMVSRRAYHGPHKPHLAVRDLYVKLGQQIDNAIAATLIRVIGVYPVGTLVRLKSGEIGVVTGPGQGPDTPAVHVVIAKSGLFLEVASHRKTHRAEFAIDEVMTHEKLTTPVRMANLWGKEARCV